MTKTYTIRNLRIGDILDSELLGIWEPFLLDRQWVWVLEQEDRIDGIVIAASMHGVLFLLRVAARKTAPNMCLYAMLRTALNDAKQRGLIMGMTYLTNSPREKKLERIAKRAGWLMHPESGVWCVGRLGDY